VCEIFYNHFGAKIGNEHEYSCSKTSLKNTIASKTVDMPSVFVHFEQCECRERIRWNK